MATTVNSSFTEFMNEHVNLDKDDVSTARSSRDWLISQLNYLSDSDNNDFPTLYKEKHLGFGSFARSTKKRELDDIDHLICMSASNCWYSETGDTVHIHVPEHANKPFTDLKHDDNDLLNSTKVINLFVKNLKNIPQYQKAEKHARSGEAATLKLSSYSWNFDIVPCFFTVEDSHGKNYYIMPDGKGHWKKTDPRLDKEKSKCINQANNGNVLSIIRAMKYWNNRQTMSTMSSYLLENIILNYYSNHSAGSYISRELPSLFSHIATAVYLPVADPKEIQGDINNLTYEEKESIYSKAKKDEILANEAKDIEFTDPKKAISIWRGIFGENFPAYTGR